MGFRQLLIQSDRDGAALSNTTTATSLLHAQTKRPIPAGFFQSVPQNLYVYAAGRMSTVVTTPGTLTIDLRLGAVIIANGGAMTLSTTATTNVSWEMWWNLTLRTIGGGTAATFMHQGRFTSEAIGATNISGIAQTRMLPASAPAVGTGFDETAAAALDLFGTWQTASSSNSIQCHQFMVEAAPPL
jgi:hypothetical protein